MCCGCVGISEYVILLAIACWLSTSVSATRCLVDLSKTGDQLTNCHHRGLTTIPRDIPIGTHRLVLDHNNISTIQDTSLANLVNLRKFSAQWNNLRYIHRNAFRYLLYLEEFSISHNYIYQLSPTTFDANVRIRKVDLSYNYLSQLPEAVLRTSSIVQHIDVSHNRIRSIYPPSESSSHVNSSVNNVVNTAQYMATTTATQPMKRDVYVNIAGNQLNITTLHLQRFVKHFSVSSLDLSDNGPQMTLPVIKLIIRKLSRQLSTLVVKQLHIIRLPSYLFGDLKLYRLREIDFSKNLISEVKPPSSASLPQLFSCTLGYNKLDEIPDFSKLPSLKRIYLGHNYISRIRGAHFPSHIEVIDLSHNRITVFRCINLLRQTALRNIDLTNNYIYTFQASARPPPLTHLRLASNQLRENNINDLAETFRYLTHLDVSHNRIAHIYPDLFKNHTNLLFLNLSRNLFSQLFQIDLGVKNLRVLDISFNRVQSLHEYKMPYLAELYLSNNIISNLQKSCFSISRNIRLLDLSGNPIRARTLSLCKDIFARLSKSLIVLKLDSVEIYPYLRNDNWGFLRAFDNIQQVSLRSCSITFPPGQASKFPASIRTLDLSYNFITKISSKSFAGATSLNEIRLIGNSINAIDVASFSRISNLRLLDLRRNHFTCDCQSFQHFLRWAKVTNVTVWGFHNNGLTCSHPETLAGRSIALFDDSECEDRNSTKLFLFAVGAALAILVVSAIPYLIALRCSGRRKRKFVKRKHQTHTPLLSRSRHTVADSAQNMEI